jgi:pyruvate dehydrogenase E1 component beta subunit
MSTEVRLGKALNMALADAMGADDSVFLLGEDIGVTGGPFGVTRKLIEQFGASRVRDTPISEAAMAHAAVGAALSGSRPVLEIMFMDFITLAMDALVNQAAKAHYMFGGQASVPLVVRMPHGGGISAGPQHSQCLEAWFAHVPGLKVVCPSTVADAYGLLRAAIQDPDPTVFIENKAMYAMKGVLPESPQVGVIGSAEIVRSGDDATVVTYGAARETCEAACAAVADGGIAVELVDLRTIQPWDRQTVLDSLARTHRLLIVHEAVEAFGVGAEIAAVAAEAGFDDLDAPVMRVGAPFSPIPFAPGMEKGYVPSVERVVKAINNLCQ